MAYRRSIRARRNRKAIVEHFELPLTSMLDVLMILLVFLLKSYSVSITTFQPVPGMELPYSVSPDVPPESLYVIVTPEAITFENERVVEFIQSATSSTDEASYQFNKSDLDEGRRRIVPLYNVLLKAREDSEILRRKSQERDAEGKPLPFEGVLAIQADKRISFDTIRKIMYTAAAAEFKVFRFLGQKREGT